MTDPMSFEQLSSLFVVSLLDKAKAFSGTSLSSFQRSRLGESMTADIRKLGDMVFPAARTPWVSVAAARLAAATGHDLAQETWHSQKKIDGYKTINYEHLFPVKEIRNALADADTVADAQRVLHRMLWIAWITKDEDQRLRDLGFATVRPDPMEAYRLAGIDLLPNQHADEAAESHRCSSCGHSPASWLVTGASESNAPGRLFLRCETCRRDSPSQIGVAVPIPVLSCDQNAILSALYRAGATRTDPDAAMEVLGPEPGVWIAVAREELARDSPHPADPASDDGPVGPSQIRRF